MTHANVYGLQVGDCPGSNETYVPSEPEKDCGVDPFTGSGTSFDRGSGGNAYEIEVKNTAVSSGAETLTCSHGAWENSPTAFSYAWLRDGTPIPGATESTYVTTPTDAGQAVQCLVTATNEGGGTDTAPPPTVVQPAPVLAPPTTSYAEAAAFVEVEEGKEPEPGNVLACSPNESDWSGNPSYSYEWVRDGELIPGASSGEYTLTASDQGDAVQCLVIGANAGGASVGESNGRLLVLPEPATVPPVREIGTARVDTESSGDTTGTVTVADALPQGLQLAPAGGVGGPGVEGQGWSCQTAAATAFTCTRADILAAGHAYPRLTVIVHASSDAPDRVINAASVGGGGSASAVTAEDSTTIATVPFGISSFSTFVEGESGGPFTASGGHPVAANSTFAMNYVPGDEPGSLITAGNATAKDTEVELPPGFVGDPTNATQCTTPGEPTSCPAASVVGFVHVALAGAAVLGGRAQVFNTAEVSPIWNLAPQPGHPAEFAFVVAHGLPFVLTAKVRSDGDYGLTIGDEYAGRNGPAPLGVSVTFCSNGVIGSGTNLECASTPQQGSAGPFLTLPTMCAGSPPSATLRVNSWEAPGTYVSQTTYTGAHLSGDAPSPSESLVTDCDLLQFNPVADFAPNAASEGGTTQTDEPTGASFALKVPQTNQASLNATPELKNATVTLPQGMTVDPSAADGLQACSNSQFGLGSTAEPAEAAACPLASQIGTVKVITPLLEKPLEGQVFLGQPECSPCSNTDAEDGRIFRLFLQIRSVERGVIVKLAGHVTANPATGRLQATFTEQPQLPFSELLLTFSGGARAPLANPQTCGTFTTTTDLTPWSTPGLGGLSGTEPVAGTPDATPSSSFNLDWNGAGSACPATMPFGPFFSAGSQTPTAGASSPFAVTIGREDREQDLSGITVSTPPGLLGKIAGIPQCPELQANAGSCGPDSEIGMTTVSAGPGPHPFYLSGRAYLTGPYKGQPFGLSIVTPAVAGPFNLGTVVVRAAITVNPSTAALTVASDTLPQFVDGVQLRLRTIHVEVNRPGFMVNPTSCAQQSVGASISAAQGASASPSSPFEVGGCQSLPFAPSFSASTDGRTSKQAGASLTTTITQKPGEADIAHVDVTLPKALAARLSTLHLACTETQFAANPAGCPAGSDVGRATAATPLLTRPLVGPAYVVSHGGRAFPDIDLVLQGENGITIDLTGNTNIKSAVTYTRFESVPDAPISSFGLELPEGPHSILAAGSNLCSTKSLALGVTLTGQSGAQTIRTIPIAVSGCHALKTRPLTRAQKLKRALHVCRTTYKAKGKKAKRLACETQARKRYGPIKKAKKANRKAVGR
jgi:hypothetical protein